MHRWARPAFSIALLIAVAIVFAASLRIRPAVFDPVGGRLFPLLIAGLLLVLCPVLAFRDVRAAASGKTDESGDQPRHDQSRADLRVAGLFAAFAAITVVVAFGAVPLIAGMAMIFVAGGIILLPSAGGGRALAQAAAVILLLACALAVGTHVVFERMLGIPLS